MRYVVIVCVVVLLSGCSVITYEHNDVKISYVRWFNQSIDDAEVELSDGTVLKFSGQKSDVEIALEYAGAKVGVK